MLSQFGVDLLLSTWNTRLWITTLWCYTNIFIIIIIITNSYADDSQLYFHADPTAVDNKVKQLVACIEEISHWMRANRLKLNTDKTQFIWLGTPHQLSKFVCNTFTVGGIAIQVSTKAMCLSVLLDSALTFAPHVHRLSGRSFYHLQQMMIVRKSPTQEAAKTMVHAFVTIHIDYCNSILYGTSAAHIRPLQNVLNAAIHALLHWLPVQPHDTTSHHADVCATHFTNFAQSCTTLQWQWKSQYRNSQGNGVTRIGRIYQC